MGLFRMKNIHTSKKVIELSSSFLYMHAHNLPCRTLVQELEKRNTFSSGTRDSLIQRLKQKILHDKKMVLWAKRHNNIQGEL